MHYPLPTDAEDLATLIARFQLSEDGRLYYTSERRGKKLMSVENSKTNPPQVAIGGRPYRAADIAFYLTYGRAPKPHAYSVHPTQRRFLPEDLREGDARHRGGALHMLARHPGIVAKVIEARGAPLSEDSAMYRRLASASKFEVRAFGAVEFLVEAARDPNDQLAKAFAFVLGAKAADSGSPRHLLDSVESLCREAVAKAREAIKPRPPTQAPTQAPGPAPTAAQRPAGTTPPTPRDYPSMANPNPRSHTPFDAPSELDAAEYPSATNPQADGLDDLRDLW